MDKVNNILKTVTDLSRQEIIMLPLPQVAIDDVLIMLSKVKAKRCSEVERLHRKKWRQFCHTMHKDNVICCASEINNLPEENINGLMYHEIAHIIADQYNEILYQDSGLFVERDKEDNMIFILDGQEVDSEIFADAVAERILNARIYYDKNKLQWVEIQHY